MFGSYEIVRPLGRGAFGAVYEALRLPLRKPTALKVLHREFVRHREVVDRFLREAEIVAQLDHPHIVDVFDVGVEGGIPFIAMEFLHGETLTLRIARQRPIPVPVAVDLMLAVMSAVATVHEKGIVHRDLKPDNIFLARQSTGSSQPKLLDFGIAKVADSSVALTRTNTMMGTPSYMSPEQAEESKHVGPATDQWALGVILYECVAGAKAFQGDNLLSLLNAITSRPITPPRAVNPQVPEALEAVILRTMDRAPARRFATVRAFGAALLPFASAKGAEEWSEFFREGAPAGLDDFSRVSLPAAAVAPTLEPSTSSVVPAARASRRGVAIGLTALVLVGAAVVAGKLAVPQADPTAFAPASTHAPVVAPVAHTAALATTAPIAARPPVPPPVADSEVRLSVDSPTSGAFAIVRGERHELPWETRLTRTSSPEPVEVRAPGKGGLRFRVPLDRPQRLTVTLHRGHGVDDATAAETQLALGASGTTQGRSARSDGHARRESPSPAAPAPAPVVLPAPAVAATAPAVPAPAAPAPSPRPRGGASIYQGPSGTIPSEL
jgi:serine/threonine-protein kinase